MSSGMKIALKVDVDTYHGTRKGVPRLAELLRKRFPKAQVKDLTPILDGMRAVKSPREIALTFISHAECHIPLPIIEALARDATLYGIFVLPSKAMDLDYKLSMKPPPSSTLVDRVLEQFRDAGCHVR